MEHSTIMQNGIKVIELTGRFDSIAAPLFDSWFEEHDELQDKLYLVDLAAVPYITSAGLRSILKMLKLLNSRGGNLALCSVCPTVQDLLEMSGFTKFLRIFDNREAAFSALSD